VHKPKMERMECIPVEGVVYSNCFRLMLRILTFALPTNNYSRAFNEHKTKTRSISRQFYINISMMKNPKGYEIVSVAIREIS
jgi:hypothetical protein